MANGNGKHAQVVADAFPLIEARHVDALVESVQAQTRQVTLQSDVMRKQIDVIKSLDASVKSLDASITRLADLLDASTATTSDQVTPGGGRKPGTKTPVGVPILDRRKAK